MIESKTIAHRFGAALGPENTAATLKHAVELGVRWVEFDASLLKDGTVIVFHDEEFDRCTDKTGLLKDATWDDVSQMDGGSWFSPDFKGEPILELGAALRLLDDVGMNINLEIKVNGPEHVELTERVHEIVAKNWSGKNKLLYSSFSHDALVHLRKIDSTAQIGHLFEHLPSDWQNQAEAVKAITIHADVDELSAADIQAVKAAGYPLYLYTVNDVAQGLTLLDQGVDAVFTDCPDAFKDTSSPVGGLL